MSKERCPCGLVIILFFLFMLCWLFGIRSTPQLLLCWKVGLWLVLFAGLLLSAFSIDLGVLFFVVNPGLLVLF